MRIFAAGTAGRVSLGLVAVGLVGLPVAFLVPGDPYRLVACNTAVVVLLTGAGIGILADHHNRGEALTIAPSTPAGYLTLGLFVAAVILLGTHFAVAGLGVGLLAIAAGLFTVTARHDRSALVLAGTLLPAALVSSFLLGEVAQAVGS
ncbi:hypothetical protein NCCP1664_18230 [Zafaria cholistanensis]|uniref:Uncharacterized protein n=1 Tax=Zafaria cholistanensis TaxID=1682741 RepID=A0A5A7NU11_9MICC|nr:hypothetical protein [Zafaria cholistanensis]GER23327.1 hypothetical protein NCCP1664_18230 [Zafaria cholistanensis]